MLENIKDSGIGCFVMAFLVAVILIASILCGVLDLTTQHAVFNPLQRQNIIDNPNVTIANRADFHNKLGEIIQADQNIVIALQAHDTNNAAALQQIRSQAINAYNAESDNPDTGKDRDASLPAHIDATVPSGTVDQIIQFQFYKNEINTLQKGA